MIDFKHGADGFGFRYGFVNVGGEAPARIDVMPPEPLWSGTMRLRDLPHPSLWVVFVDGEEIGRATTQQDVAALISKEVEKLRSESIGLER